MCCLEGSRKEREAQWGSPPSSSVSASQWCSCCRAREASAAVGVHPGRAELPARARAGRRAGRPDPPAVEVAAGALLAVGLGMRPVAALLALFLVAFSVAVAVNLLRGRTIDCGCFGPVAQKQITWWTVPRNVVLTAAAIVVAAVQPTALALDRLLPGTPRPDVASGSAVALLFATSS